MKIIPWMLPLGLLVALLVVWQRAAPSDRASHASDRFPHVYQLSDASYPLRIENPDGAEIKLPGPPQRVLPGNAGVVDFLSALIGPERVPAVPRDTTAFSRVGRTGVSGWADLPRFRQFAAEDILLLRPDLVISHAWQHPETHSALARHGIPVLTLPVPRDWAEVLLELRLFGQVLGEPERAREVETQLEGRREQLAQQLGHRSGLRVLTYSNFGAGGFTAGKGTTVDIFLGLAGVTNAASEAGLEGHAQLDYEHLLTIDPDVIVLAARESETGTVTADILRDVEALADMRAVRTGHIAYLDPAVLTTTSLELMRAAEELQAELLRLYP